MSNFKFIFTKRFLKHLGLAFALFVVLGFITLQLLNVYTSHGEAVAIPDLRGLQKEEAQKVLEKKDLRIEVIDSVFMADKEPGVVVEQNPTAESKIKKGRKVYVVINSKIKKKIPLPDVREISLRQAQSILESVGLKVASVEYIPSEFKNLVQQVKVNKNIIETGQSVLVGSQVVLVVGQGLSEEQINLPSFRGLKLDEAKKKSYEIVINLGSVQYDEQPKNNDDIKNYIVYKQSPITGTKVNLGKYIDIWLTKDKSKIEQPEDIQITKDNDIENFYK
jgi:beta-lactam-binding protein with PASTA domain